MPYASKLEIHPAFRAGLRIPEDGSRTTVAIIGGSGAIAQGPGATSVGDRGVMISGSVGGSIVTGGNIIAGHDFVGRDKIELHRLNQYTFTYLSELVEKIQRYFNLVEIKELCLRLKLDYGNLLGDSKYEKILSLIEYLQIRERIPDLLDYLREQRPHANW